MVSREWGNHLGEQLAKEANKEKSKSRLINLGISLRELRRLWRRMERIPPLYTFEL